MPTAMVWGCSYELFWKLNPRKLKAFERAYKERTEALHTAIDILAWRVGRYCVNSVACGLDGRRNKYPEKPDTLRPSPEEEEAQRIHAWMMNHARYMREKKRAQQNKVKQDG
ncbi:MAG: hypothetical protein IKN54_06215 [Lachnospiraceae bacterium]|nr:hypothetical protein [Lachnospiraceae bacterium]